MLLEKACFQVKQISQRVWRLWMEFFLKFHFWLRIFLANPILNKKRLVAPDFEKKSFQCVRFFWKVGFRTSFCFQKILFFLISLPEKVNSVLWGFLRNQICHENHFGKKFMEHLRGIDASEHFQLTNYFLLPLKQLPKIEPIQTVCILTMSVDKSESKGVEKLHEWKIAMLWQVLITTQQLSDLW